MEFTVNGTQLLEGFQLAGSVVGPKATREVSRNTKLVARPGSGEEPPSVGIYAVGDETALHYRLQPESVQVEGEVVLPSETMVGVLREAREGEIGLKVSDWSCEVTIDSSFFRVLGEDPGGFPEVMEFDSESAFTVGAAQLRSMISRVLFAASTEDTRYAMNGVLFAPQKGALELVATDGRRLAHVQAKVPSVSEGEAVIVPRAAVGHLLKLLPTGEDTEVRIAMTENHFALESDRGVLFTRLIDGNFPPYRDVIPSECKFKVDFDLGVLQSAVRRAALLTDPTSKTVQFRFNDRQLEISSRTADKGEARITVGIGYEEEGEFLTHFNPDYISDCLKVLGGQGVTMEFTEASRQAVLRDGEGFSYVLMPVTPNVA